MQNDVSFGIPTIILLSCLILVSVDQQFRRTFCHTSGARVETAGQCELPNDIVSCVAGMSRQLQAKAVISQSLAWDG